MKKVVVLASLALIVGVGLAGQALCKNACGAAPQCAPACSYVTRMVPCVKTELVPEVQPCSVVVPETKVGYRCRPVMIKGVPVGCPAGAGSCVQCYPQPFCQVVNQTVPFYYTVPKVVPSYNLVYRKVCKPVWLPQTYQVQAVPLCN
jgi:hypothetical protein